MKRLTRVRDPYYETGRSVLLSMLSCLCYSCLLFTGFLFSVLDNTYTFVKILDWDVLLSYFPGLLCWGPSLTKPNNAGFCALKGKRYEHEHLYATFNIFCKPVGLKHAISSTKTEFILYKLKLVLTFFTWCNNVSILKRSLCVMNLSNSFFPLCRVELSRLNRLERFVVILHKSFAPFDNLYAEGHEIYVCCHQWWRIVHLPFLVD